MISFAVLILWKVFLPVSQSSSETVANDQPIKNDTHSEENKNNLDVSPPNLIPTGQDVHGSGKANSKGI